MFDAHFAYIVIICNIVLSCELSALLALSSRLDILVRCEVIHYKRNLILVEYAAEACLVELVYRNWACNIVTEYHIQLCSYKLSLSYAFKSCVLCQYLLAHCHAHVFVLPFFCRSLQAVPYDLFTLITFKCRNTRSYNLFYSVGLEKSYERIYLLGFARKLKHKSALCYVYDLRSEKICNLYHRLT